MCLYVGYLLLLHYILYKNGCLGDYLSNTLAYCIAVMNLGQTCKQVDYKDENNNKRKPWASAIFRFIVNATYFNCFHHLLIKCKCKLYLEYSRYLTFYYLMARNLQGLIIVVVTIILYYATEEYGDCYICTTSKSSRYANQRLFTAFLYIALVSYILQPIFFYFIFDSLHLGMSLVRDAKTLVLKYQFADGIRILKLQGHSDFQICEKVLNWILNEKLPILLIDREDNNIAGTPGASGNISEELEKEGIYFIEWIESVSEASIARAKKQYGGCEGSKNENEKGKKEENEERKDDSKDDESDEDDEREKEEEKETEVMAQKEEMKEDFVGLFDALFEQAVSQCHSTMIYFLVCNNLLIEVGGKKFDNDTKNVFEFLLDSCFHRSDIIETLLIRYNKYFDNHLPHLLAVQTGGIRANGDPQYLIDKFVQNDQSLAFGTLIEFVCQKYFDSIRKTLFIRSILYNEYAYAAKYVKISKHELNRLMETNRIQYTFDESVNSRFTTCLYIILKNNDLYIDKVFNCIKCARFLEQVLYESESDIENESKFLLFLKFVDLISDINETKFYQSTTQYKNGDYSTLIGMILSKMDSTKKKYCKHLRTVLYKYKNDILTEEQYIDGKKIAMMDFAKERKNKELEQMLNKYVRRMKGQMKPTVSMIAGVAVDINSDEEDNGPSVDLTVDLEKPKDVQVAMERKSEVNNMIAPMLTKSVTFLDVTKNLAVKLEEDDVYGMDEANGQSGDADEYMNSIYGSLVENNDASLYDVLLESCNGHGLSPGKLYSLIEQYHSTAFSSLLLWLTILSKYSDADAMKRLFGDLSIEMIEDQLGFGQLLLCMKLLQIGSQVMTKSRKLDFIKSIFEHSTTFLHYVFARDDGLLLLPTWCKMLMSKGDLDDETVRASSLLSQFDDDDNGWTKFESFLRECKILRIPECDNWASMLNPKTKNGKKRKEKDANYLLKIFLRYCLPSAKQTTKKEFGMIYDKFVNGKFKTTVGKGRKATTTVTPVDYNEESMAILETLYKKYYRWGVEDWFTKLVEENNIYMIEKSIEWEKEARDKDIVNLKDMVRYSKSLEMLNYLLKLQKKNILHLNYNSTGNMESYVFGYCLRHRFTDVLKFIIDKKNEIYNEFGRKIDIDSLLFYKFGQNDRHRFVESLVKYINCRRELDKYREKKQVIILPCFALKHDSKVDRWIFSSKLLNCSNFKTQGRSITDYCETTNDIKTLEFLNKHHSKIIDLLQHGNYLYVELTNLQSVKKVVAAIVYFIKTKEKEKEASKVEQMKQESKNDEMGSMHSDSLTDLDEKMLTHVAEIKEFESEKEREESIQKLFEISCVKQLGVNDKNRDKNMNEFQGITYAQQQQLWLNTLCLNHKRLFFELKSPMLANKMMFAVKPKVYWTRFIRYGHRDIIESILKSDLQHGTNFFDPLTITAIGKICIQYNRLDNLIKFVNIDDKAPAGKKRMDVNFFKTVWKFGHPFGFITDATRFGKLKNIFEKHATYRENANEILREIAKIGEMYDDDNNGGGKVIAKIKYSKMACDLLHPAVSRRDEKWYNELKSFEDEYVACVNVNKEMPIYSIVDSLIAFYAKIEYHNNTVMMRWILDKIFCNINYFSNNEYRYYIKCDELATEFYSKQPGIHLFHSILKQDSMITLFNALISKFETIYVTTRKQDERNEYKESKEQTDDAIVLSKEFLSKYQTLSDILLTTNEESRIPLQCIVFGSYNEQYKLIIFERAKAKKKKNSKMDEKQLDKENKFFKMIHFIQYHTNLIKLKSIQ